MKRCKYLRTYRRSCSQTQIRRQSRMFSHKPTTVCFIGCFSNTSAQQTTLQLQRWRVASKYTSPASFTGRPILLWSASKAFEKIHTVQTKSEEVKKDPLMQTFLFHADNILMTNTKKQKQNKPNEQGKQSKSIYSACLFQVPLRK